MHYQSNIFTISNYNTCNTSVYNNRHLKNAESKVVFYCPYNKIETIEKKCLSIVQEFFYFKKVCRNDILTSKNASHTISSIRCYVLYNGYMIPLSQFNPNYKMNKRYFRLRKRIWFVLHKSFFINKIKNSNLNYHIKG